MEVGGPKRISSNSLHLGIDVFGKAELAVLVLLVQIFLEIGIGEFIALLVPAVKGGILLDSIVGEMDHLVAHVLQVEVEGRGPDVALPVPIRPHYAVQSGDYHVVPDIEFAALVEQRALDVLLHDVGLLCPLRVLLLLL